MVGMVESLNISVSAALSMYELTKMLKNSWEMKSINLAKREEKKFSQIGCADTRETTSSSLKDFVKKNKIKPLQIEEAFLMYIHKNTGISSKVLTE